MNIDEIASYCKRKAIIFPNSDIYGGYAGFWDYGPIGAELKNNIKKEWWEFFVHQRENIVGIDGAIITHPTVWKASGHVDSFIDPLVECKKCHARRRADHLVKDALKIPTDNMSFKELDEKIKKHKIKCPVCRSEFSDVRVFNLMFKTNVGPTTGENSVSYLRPETAQVIFTNFKPVVDTTRVKIPFGIAQIGKAFRNEISPRNFVFRSREFEQMEIEFFVDPDKKNDCPDLKKVWDLKANILDRKLQEKEKGHRKMTIREAVEKKIMVNHWHAYWIALSYKWLLGLGINPEKLRLRQHTKEELSHYAEDTWDVEYHYPFGWKELQGIANRTQFDLSQHQKFSKVNLEYFDEATKRKFIPYVAAEPSIGVERLVFTIITDALEEEEERTVLKIHPKLAPYKVAVFPLVKKDKLPEKAREVFKILSSQFHSFYDESGSIGRRYRRMDEIGTPFAVTVDYDSLKDNTVTVRDRDSMEQERVEINKLIAYLRKKLLS